MCYRKKKTRTLDGSIVIWNFTNRCNLLCHHCYSKADPNGDDFLTTENILQTIPSLKKAGINFVIFSGGEPLIRKDIFIIAEKMKEHNIFTYLSTNGMYINEKNVRKIIETFNYIGISIDGIEDTHDFFRGQVGAYKKSLDSIKLIQQNGGNAGIRFTITNETKKDFYSIFELAEKTGINKIYISHLVYSGRGLDNLKIDLTKNERREYVKFIIDKAFEYYETNRDIDIVTGNMEMDAIYFLDIFSKKYPDLKNEMNTRLTKWGGNSAGVRLGNINYKGDVKPDPFFPLDVGNILTTPFEQIWNGDNGILKKLREKPRNISGKCSVCEYIDICNGGSRSRSFAITGDLWDEDPSCYLSNEEIKRL